MPFDQVGDDLGQLATLRRLSSWIIRGMRFARAYTQPVWRTSSCPSTRAQKNWPDRTSLATA